MKNRTVHAGIEVLAVLMSIIIFGVPIYYVFVNAGKTSVEAAQATIVYPEKSQFIDNFVRALEEADYMLVRAFYNSALITALSIVLLLVVASMTGFVLARRKSKAVTAINFLILSGLMVPPAIVPTIWILRSLGLYRNLFGLVLIEVALTFPFAVLLYRGYMAAIPRELDEASFVDGSTGFQLFINVIAPLTKPVTATIAVITAIVIYNDFVHPLYFLPGAENVTVQLTLYNYIGKYFSQWNLLFANVFLISIPPLLFFALFNKKIVSGMVAGAVKG